MSDICDYCVEQIEPYELPVKWSGEVFHKECAPDEAVKASWGNV